MREVTGTAIRNEAAPGSYWPVVKTILFAGLIAGTLDGLAAIIVYGPVFGNASVAGIFQGIASGAFGKKAFDGGLEMVLYGVFFHYFIACSFATTYFFLYPLILILSVPTLIRGIFYGLLVWIFMNLILLPLVSIHIVFTPLKAIKGIVILMICVGIPIVTIIERRFPSVKQFGPN